MAEPQSIPQQWEAFRDRVRSRVPPMTWQTWLAPLEAAEEDGRLTIIAPSELHRRWVAEKHLDVLEEATTTIYGSTVALALTANAVALTEELDLEEDEEPEPERPVLAHSRPHPPEAGLVERYRFESFVVGPSNRFAHAAAMAIAEQPGTHYNPLFIYGGAGLGKTHLLHAIGHHAMELHGHHSIKYVTSEQFFNEFIDGIRSKRMAEFKSRYRSIDVLLLDDVQFFEGKEQILEEFFHTFNSLYESARQLVISSDRHPRHLSSLEDRLRSRFEWGLLTDIQPPDVETRLAILRTNAEVSPVGVPEPVLSFIAEHVSDNIRELEGALTRVTAYATLTDQPVNLELAQRVLADILPAERNRPLSADDIVRITAESYGFRVDELKGPSRRQPLALSRQIAMYLCRDLTDLSLPKIGALFGGRDHTTVIHAVDKIKRLLQSDQDIFDSVTSISQDLRRT